LSAADRDRLGVYWGTGMGGAHTLESAYKNVYGAGEWRVRPLTVVMAMNNAAGSNVAVRHGLRGPFANFSTACSSSAMAIGEAMHVIRGGRADAMVAGGAEALLTPGMLAAWQALRTLSPADAADPAASCKPFDKRRGGLLLGGAGALEMAAALMPFSDGTVPPTANLEQPDPACAVRHVPMKAEKIEIPKAVMSNSFAFGGSNVVLIAERA